MSLKNRVLQLFFQLFSFGVSALAIVSIFFLHVGALELYHAIPIVLTVSTAVVFRYTAMYHRFTRTRYRYVFAVLTGIVATLSVSVTVVLISDNLLLDEVREFFRGEEFTAKQDGFLPDWWYSAVLLVALLLVFVGTVVTRKTRPYPKPTGFRNAAISPVYFGNACAFFGLWAVLFVGIGIQRVIVIAPIFEELLKFGIAIVVSSVLFDRSTAARVGVAIVVGSLFGVIEHATTYPDEADVIYLYRTAFHATTTAVSVAVYTMFEQAEMDGLLWVSPVFPMLFHFFYNTFSVLSAVLTFVLIGSRLESVVIVYGAVAVLACLVLLLLAVAKHRLIYTIHRPIYDVLSDIT